MIFFSIKYLHFASVWVKQEDISFADNYDVVPYSHPTVATLSLISVLSTWQPCIYRVCQKKCTHFNCFRSLSVHKFQRSLVMTMRVTFSKMEHLPTTIAMYELTSMQVFQTHGLDEGVPLNTLRFPQTSRPWTSFCGVISKTKFIVQNKEQLMHWNWKLKDHIAIFLMTCFVTFVNPLVHIVWTIMVINLNICKHDSSITFVFCIRSYSISLYVHK